MKKLLSLLGAVIVSASSAAVVVSCSYAPTQFALIEDEKYTDADISAEALKSAVLADQNVKLKNGQKGYIDFEYANDYYGNQQILKRFPYLVSDNQGAKPNSESTVSSLFGRFFGNAQGGDFYNPIINSSSSMLAGINPANNSNLYKIAKAYADAKANNQTVDKTQFKNLYAPDSDGIASTLTTVSGIAGIAFKNDFSPTMGTTLVSLLGTGTVKNALAGMNIKQDDGSTKTIGQLVGEISNTAGKYEDQINNILNSITQENVDEKTTYEQQLTSATNSLAGGLIYFITGKTKIYDDKSGVSAPQALWSWIFNNDSTEGLTDPLTVSDDDKTPDVLKNILNSIADIANFGITLLHYFRAFDSEEVLGHKNLKVENPKVKHIFSELDSDENAQVIDTVLGKSYVGDKYSQFDKGVQENDFWYKADGKLSTKLNLQNLISDLTYYLTPSSDDPFGYQMLRLFTILFGTAGKAGMSHHLNPILSTALNPLFDALKQQDGPLQKAITGVIGTSILSPAEANIVVKDLVDVLDTSIVETIDWFLSDGNSQSTIVSTIKALSGLLSKIDISQFVSNNEKLKNILSIVVAVGKALNSSDVLDSPWTSLYSGNLLSSAASALKNVKDDKLLTQVANILSSFKNIKHATQEMTIGDMGKVLNFQVPDFIYSFRNMKIKDILTKFSSTWISDGGQFKSATQNNQYSFNTRALVNIVNSVLPYDNDDVVKNFKVEDNVLKPYNKNDNSGINALSAVLNSDTGIITITLNYPLQKALNLNTSSVSIEGHAKFKQVQILGTEQGSSTIEIHLDNNDSILSTEKPNAKINIDLGDNASTSVQLGSENVADQIIAFKLDKDTKQLVPVSILEPLIYSILHYGENANNDKIDTSYYVKLRGEKYDNPVHEIVSPNPFAVTVSDNGKNFKNSNVSVEAFENLLGLNDTGDVTSFKPGGLLMGISNLYGHWDAYYDEGSSTNSNAAAAESLITFFGDVAGFATSSVAELTKKIYEPYLEERSWRILNVRATGLKDIDPNKETVQTLDYDLIFINPNNGSKSTYEVSLKKTIYPFGSNPNAGWVVTRLWRK